MTDKVTDWMYRQSAVIAYRRGGDGPEVLLITSRKKMRWVLPKGVVEPGMTPPASAANVGFEIFASARYIDRKARHKNMLYLVGR